MTKLFYDHLIIIEEVLFVLDRHTLSTEERKKLLSLIDQTLNHNILDEILTHLPKTYHEEFLEKFTSHPYDSGLITYLKEKTSADIEKKIFEKAEKVKKQLIKELQK